MSGGAVYWAVACKCGAWLMSHCDVNERNAPASVTCRVCSETYYQPRRSYDFVGDNDVVFALSEQVAQQRELLARAAGAESYAALLKEANEAFAEESGRLRAELEEARSLLREEAKSGVAPATTRYLQRRKGQDT